MNTRLWKYLARLAGAAGIILMIVLVTSTVQALVGGSVMPTRLFVTLVIVDGFLGQASVILYAGRKFITAMALTEARRTAAYMKGVRDTLAETGISVPSPRRSGEVGTANGRLHRV